jgi:glutathione S-transferase
LYGIGPTSHQTPKCPPVTLSLYCNLTSPYSRKVRVVARELGIADSVKEIITDPFSAPAEFLAVNPLARIPALLTDHGEALPDSTLIVDYLLHRWPGRLRPLQVDPPDWPRARRERVAQGIIDAAVASVLERRRPDSIHYTPFLDRQNDVIERSLETLALEVDVLNAETPDVVDITVGVALDYIGFRLPWLEWRSRHKALAEWSDAFSSRPSMLETQPPRS